MMVICHFTLFLKLFHEHSLFYYYVSYYGTLILEDSSQVATQ